MAERSVETQIADAEWRGRAAWRRADAIDVWRVDWVMTGDLAAHESRADAWADARLTAGERQRAARLVVPSKRRQFARSRAALRTVLGWHLDTDPLKLRFRTGPHGRPEVDGATFNLSHSGTVAVIAVGAGSTTRIGVDVERVEPERPVDRLVERFFAAGEAKAFSRLDRADRAADFARRWALKESYVKALGTGLTYSSTGFVLRDDPVSWRPRPLLESCSRFGASHRRWCFRNLWIDAGPDRFAMALCSDDAARARTFRFDFPVRDG